MRRTTALRGRGFVMCLEDASDRQKKGRLTAEEAGERLVILARDFRRMRICDEVDGVDGRRDRLAGRTSGDGGRRREEAGAQAPALPRGRRRLHRKALPWAVSRERRRRRRPGGRGRTCCAKERRGLGRQGQTARSASGKQASLPAVAWATRASVCPGLILGTARPTACIFVLDHDLDLVVTLDDATVVIYWVAPRAAQEGTMSKPFPGSRETIGAHGLFCVFVERLAVRTTS